MLNIFTAINEPDIDVIFNFCIMGKIPFILVEGMDDIPKYHSILSRSSNYSDVLYIEAVENITNYSLGCDEVIRCIDDLYNNHPQQHDKIDTFIISIIDKDIRNIKNTIPAHKTHIILKEYSIESIYVSKESVEIILNLLIKGPSNLISEAIINDMFDEVIDNLIDELYYSSLDALNFSLNSIHKKIRYKYEYGFIENNITDFSNQLSTDNQYKISLDNLAINYGFDKDLASLTLFVKGKWLYRSFIKNIVENSKELQTKCGSQLIHTCSYCKLGKYDQCLYKTILTQGSDHIDNHLFKILPENSSFTGFDYIVEDFDSRMNIINALS